MSGSSDSEGNLLDWEDDFRPEKEDSIGDIEIDLDGNEDRKHLEVNEDPARKRQRSYDGRGPRMLWNKHDLTRSTGYHWHHIEHSLATGIFVARAGTDILIRAAMLSILPISLSTTITQFQRWDVHCRMKYLQSLQEWVSSYFQLVPASVQERNSADADEGKGRSKVHIIPRGSLRSDGLKLALTTARASSDQLCVLLLCLLEAMGLETRLVCAIDPPSWRPQQHWELYKEAWLRGQEEYRNRTNAASTSTGARVSSSSSSTTSTSKKRDRDRQGLVLALTATATSSETYASHVPEPESSVHVHVSEGIDRDVDVERKRQQWERKHLSLQRKTQYWLEVFLPEHADNNTSSNTNSSRSESGGSSRHTGRWVHMNPLKSTVLSTDTDTGTVTVTGLDNPLLVETHHRRIGSRIHAFQYVCAIDCIGRCVDVTRKYTSRPDLSAALTSENLQLLWLARLQQLTDEAQIAAAIAVERIGNEKDKEEKKGNSVSSSSSSTSSSSLRLQTRTSTRTRTVISILDSDEEQKQEQKEGKKMAESSASALDSMTSSRVVNTSTSITSKSNSKSSSNSSTESIFMKRRQEEKAQILQSVAKTPKPTTLSGYKSHPDYVLNCDGHMKSNEVILPNARPIGLFKGHTIYRRSDVSLALSRKNWRKQYMRDVLVECVNEPVFMQTRTDRRGKEAGGERNKERRQATATEQFDVALYGVWQTKPLIIPAVQNGVIPVNKYGNVEVWDYQESLIPCGARLLQSKECNISVAQRLCADWNFPCAPAVVGFERLNASAGGSVQARAVLGGIVVLVEHYDKIREGASDLAEKDHEEEAHRREAYNVKMWEMLVRHVLSRNRLKVMYGH